MNLEQEPYFRPGENLFLNNLIVDLPYDSLILEIGTFRGWSAILMAKARPDVKVITIDSHIGIPEDLLVSSEAEAKKNIHDSLCSLQVTHIPESSQDYTPKTKFDMVFIDGDHTFEGVKHDFKKFLPFVKDDGIILFHDYMYESGVTKFCATLKYRAAQQFKGMLAIKKGDLC